jgi:serine/threonine protein kinase
MFTRHSNTDPHNIFLLVTKQQQIKKKTVRYNLIFCSHDPNKKNSMPTPATLIDSLSSVGEDLKYTCDFINDFDLSVRLMTRSFLTWKRLEKNNIVKEMTLKDIRKRPNWRDRYPDSFMLLHRGASCKESIVVGTGHYSKVYKRGRYAYKLIKFSREGPSRESHFSLLKCNLKELFYFHSMHHENIMRPTRSQMVLENGRIRRIIHELPLAKCTLMKLIVSNEINSFEDIYTVMAGTARALEYMHNLSIVHGDVKPSNVLIMPDYTPMLSDFTLTTFQNKGVEIAFGTLFWRAPECILQRECSEKSDVWSFGIMLLDCLYGKVYFRDVLYAEDGMGILVELINVIGQPPMDWVHKYMSDKTEYLFRSGNSGGGQEQRNTAFNVIGRDSDQIEFADLISHILQWHPEDRFTMTQVLHHPFFNHVEENVSSLFKPLTIDSKDTRFSSMIVNTIRNDDKLKYQTWVIQWRNEFEKTHMQQTVLKWHKSLFETGSSPYCVPADWLLNDITIATKRIVEKLRYINCTFNSENIVKWCTCMYCFIWENRLVESPEFESSIYHILKLLNFVGFPLIVKESQLGRNPKPV